MPPARCAWSWAPGSSCGCRWRCSVAPCRCGCAWKWPRRQRTSSLAASNMIISPTSASAARCDRVRAGRSSNSTIGRPNRASVVACPSPHARPRRPARARPVVGIGGDQGRDRRQVVWIGGVAQAEQQGDGQHHHERLAMRQLGDPVVKPEHRAPSQPPRARRPPRPARRRSRRRSAAAAPARARAARRRPAAPTVCSSRRRFWNTPPESTTSLGLAALGGERARPCRRVGERVVEARRDRCRRRRRPRGRPATARIVARASITSGPSSSSSGSG